MSGIWAESPIETALTVAPTEWPVSVAEAKLHCRAEETSIEDASFTRWIRAITAKAETALGGKQICTATRALYLNKFPCRNDIAIPYPPLRTVTGITYVDVDGVTQTWSSAQYQVDTARSPGRVVLHPDYSYPATKSGILHAVTITFTCGYGAASDVPDSIKEAILECVAFKYEHRGDDDVKTSDIIDQMLAEMLSPEIMLVV